MTLQLPNEEVQTLIIQETLNVSFFFLDRYYVADTQNSNPVKNTSKTFLHVVQSIFTVPDLIMNYLIHFGLIFVEEVLHR